MVRWPARCRGGRHHPLRGICFWRTRSGLGLRRWGRSDGGAKGGFGFTGGGGDFGTRFGWYVDTVRRKVSDNWLKYEIDPRIGEARRVYLVFDITRDGHPSHIEVEQSSGVPSLDQSAVRALQRIDTFGPLPSDYSGNKVSVEFWFDYKR